MGMRTVVMLNNDHCHVWMKDPELGQKIYRAMNRVNSKDNELDPYGSVVECAHADTQTLVRLDHYTGFEPVSYTSRTYGHSNEEDMILLLKDAAYKLGYRLVKKGK